MVNYTTEFKCKNCNRINYMTLEKGTTVKEHIIKNNIKCSECNCLLIESKDEE